MDFIDALALLKKFPSCHPKIFRGFSEWGICDSETEGYIILADIAETKEPDFKQLEDYAKSHNLRVDEGQDFLVISTVCYFPAIEL
jgi:hypothetical protein